MRDIINPQVLHSERRGKKITLGHPKCQGDPRKLTALTKDTLYFVTLLAASDESCCWGGQVQFVANCRPSSSFGIDDYYIAGAAMGRIGIDFHFRTIQIRCRPLAGIPSCYLLSTQFSSFLATFLTFQISFLNKNSAFSLLHLHCLRTVIAIPSKKWVAQRSCSRPSPSLIRRRRCPHRRIRNGLVHRTNPRRRITDTTFCTASEGRMSSGVTWSPTGIFIRYARLKKEICFPCRELNPGLLGESQVS